MLLPPILSHPDLPFPILSYLPAFALHNNYHTAAAANVRFAFFVDQNTLYPLTQHKYTVKVATITTGSYLRATLSWFDPPNTEFASRVLVNDLDLVVISPTGVAIYGNRYLPSHSLQFLNYRTPLNQPYNTHSNTP